MSVLLIRQFTPECVTSSRLNSKNHAHKATSKTLKRAPSLKNLAPALKVLQELAGGDKSLRYLCEDETRLGLQTIPGWLITLKGVKPIGMVQWMRDNFYLYGVVEPLSGDSFFYEFSHLDSSCDQHFLEMVSRHWSDSIVVMPMDRGKFHCARDLDWPENIIGIFQPAHAPELHPIERLWAYLTAQLLWENCQSLTQLRRRLCNILDGLTPDLITSLTGWDFITAAVFSFSSH